MSNLFIILISDASKIRLSYLGVEIKSARNFRRKNELEQLASSVISLINYLCLGIESIRFESSSFVSKDFINQGILLNSILFLYYLRYFDYKCCYECQITVF